MQIAVFGSSKETMTEREKKDARMLGQLLAKNGMGPLFANMDSGLAREVACGAREHNDRMIIIGTLPTERHIDPKKITFSEWPYSATYFTNITNKIRSCSAAIFIGNGPDVLEALDVTYDHAPEKFVIGIFDNANGLFKELAGIVGKSDKHPCVVLHSADPAALAGAVSAEVMQSHMQKQKNVITGTAER